ncbi:MAG: zinc-finger-containing protein [Duodenibacillus sp.]
MLTGAQSAERTRERTSQCQRRIKIECHELFDRRWTTRDDRSRQYRWLADRMGIPVSECHFGSFDEDHLRKAKEILQRGSFENGKD